MINIASGFIFRLLLVAAAILSNSVCYQGVFAEEECINKGIPCYNCDSVQDPNCADPWNFTEYYDIGIPIQKCVGCCVKIVTFNTSGGVRVSTNVRRTCTSSLQINLFLVDHVCMDESDGNGHMCFCESDLCNAASSVQPWFQLFGDFWIKLLTQKIFYFDQPGYREFTFRNEILSSRFRPFSSSIHVLGVSVVALFVHSFIGTHLLHFSGTTML